jgi:hypothetical protein
MDGPGFDLFTLPAIVLCVFLSTRLTPKELARLDSAYCVNETRHTWTQLLQSKSLTFQSPAAISNVKLVQWLHFKRIRASNVEFYYKVRMHAQSVSEYLRFCGNSVRTVHFNGGGRNLQEMMLITIYCKYLTVLRATNATVTSAFQDLLWCNPNIREIWCTNVKSAESNIFDGLSLQKLQLCNMYDCDCNTGFPWSETAFSNSLHTVVWEFSNIETEDLHALLQNCAQLRSLSLDRISLGDYAFTRFVDFGLKLYNLSLADNREISDVGVLCMVKGLPTLRSLNIQHCTELTDLSLSYIAEHCSNTLEILYTDIKTPKSAETEHYLAQFGQLCVRLRVLNIYCAHYELCNEAVTKLILQGCEELSTLVVNNYTTICTSCRDLIAMSRSELNILMNDDSTAYDIMTMLIC